MEAIFGEEKVLHVCELADELTREEKLEDTKKSWLNFCQENLSISDPDIFMNTYYNKVRLSTPYGKGGRYDPTRC